ncbi:MAG: hypothetical protein Ct9H300mP19_12410 [Dehalococcoidia bacterium]|nr:MAG: hypothetical protein Ct9H300mP19_12410 [Dehalococcoidia bacterium]
MSKLLGIGTRKYQGGFIDLGDHLVHYLDYGEGPPVLLLHGGGAGSAIWFKKDSGIIQNPTRDCTRSSGIWLVDSGCV